MATTTVRIETEKRDMLKIIAAIERTEVQEILGRLVDEYIERHRETLELFSRPEWVEAIKQGKGEVKRKVKGKSLGRLPD